tara:strand:- start:127 stop:1212 length:1086 start_codon:yes stop_codon:yes gene_type:complete
MRILLRFPFASAVLRGLGETQDHYAITMRQFQFTCLRTLWIYNCEYVWARHRVTAKQDGIDDQDLLAIAAGRGNSRLTGLDRLFSDAADELHYAHRLSDETWTALRDYHPDAPGDVIGAYAQYILMSGFSNSVGAVLEEGVDGFSTELRQMAEEKRRARRGAPRNASLQPSFARLSPLEPSAYSRAQITVMKPLRAEKIASTKMMRTFLHFPRIVTAIAAPYIRLKDCSLPTRLVHVARLRTAWLYGCETLWAEEQSECLQCGLSDAEVFAVASGPASPALAPSDAVMVRAMDELHQLGWLSDSTWDDVVKFGEEAPLDLIGAHTLASLMSTMANTLGVELEDDAIGFSPELVMLANKQVD